MWIHIEVELTLNLVAETGLVPIRTVGIEPT